MSVTPRQLQQAADRYLTCDGACGVLYVPPDVDTRLLETGWPRPPRVDDEIWQPHPIPDDSGVDRATVSQASDTVRGRLLRRPLPGVDVLARTKVGAGLVQLGFYLPGIREQESTDTAGVSALLVRTAVRGAAGRSADDLSWTAERLGGAVRPVVRGETVGWEIVVRPSEVAAGLAVLRMIAGDPTLAAKAVGLERSRMIEESARSRDDMFRHPLQEVLRAAFPHDPYGLPGIGLPETVERLGRDDLREWSNQARAKRAVLVLVGDAPAESLLDHARAFELWPGRDASLLRASVRCGPGRGAESRDKAQTAMAMAFPGPAYSMAHRDTMEVLGALLGGMAGQLFIALRERRSLAYTVVALPWVRRRASAFLTYVATAPEREDEARAAMLDELVRVTTAIDPHELDRARTYSAGIAQLRRQSARAVATEILDAWLHGSIDDLERAPRRLQSVSVDQVLELARELFNGQRAEYVVRGNGSESRL